MAAVNTHANVKHLLLATKTRHIRHGVAARRGTELTAAAVAKQTAASHRRLLPF